MRLLTYNKPKDVEDNTYKVALFGTFDVDLCKRIYINGYKIFLLPSAKVKHFKSSSFVKSDKKWASRERRSSMIKYCKKYHKNKVLFLRLLLLLK